MTKTHGFSCSSTLIQQGSIGHLHTCQISDHCLVVEEPFQTALSNLRLVRCILSCPENKVLVIFLVFNYDQGKNSLKMTLKREIWRIRKLIKQGLHLIQSLSLSLSHIHAHAHALALACLLAHSQKNDNC
jgi:hypothetical protein